MIQADEADEQHIDEVYEEAQAGLFDRDRETRHMLDGVHATGSPLRTPASGTAAGNAGGTPPSTGGSPAAASGGPPHLNGPAAQTMLRRQPSGAATSEGTSADADDALQTAQLQGGCGREACAAAGYAAMRAAWAQAAAGGAAHQPSPSPPPSALQTASRW